MLKLQGTRPKNVINDDDDDDDDDDNDDELFLWNG